MVEAAGQDVSTRSARAVNQAATVVSARRRELGLSLAELARCAGLSQGLLSQIERGQGNPSLVTLVKLGQALDLPLGSFFDGLDRSTGIVRADARPRLEVTPQNVVYELLTPHMRSRIGVVRTELAPGWTNEEAPFRHAGEECLTVVSGALFIRVGDDDTVLRAGDAWTYDASRPHWFHNRGRTPAVTIGAMTPPSF